MWQWPSHDSHDIRASALYLVPISLKIRSLLGPHFDKFRSPFHVGAVPSHDSHDIRGSALLPRFSPAEPPNSSSGLQTSLRASQSPSSSADPERLGGQGAIGGEYPKGQFLGKPTQSPQLDTKKDIRGRSSLRGSSLFCMFILRCKAAGKGCVGIC